MFKVAIKNAVNFLRPIITARLFYNSDHLNNYISTMIVLNEDGDILTTASNTDLILLSEEIGEVYNPILKELKEKSPRQIKKIEKKYGITNDTVVAMHNIIVDTANIEGKIDIIKDYTRLYGNDYVLNWYEGLMATEEFIAEVKKTAMYMWEY